MHIWDTNDEIHVNHHGFRRNHTCVTQLFELVTDIHNNIHPSIQTDALFIDVSKAFDRVPRSRLKTKLMHLNLNALVISWMIERIPI